MNLLSRPAAMRSISRGSLGDSAITGVVVAILASLAILAPLMALAGVPVSDGYQVLLDASLGSPFAFTQLLVSTTPLLIAAVGVTLAYRGGMVNVGGDGQIVTGALAATVIFGAVESLPGLAGIVAMTLAGALAGGLWAWVAGALKKWRAVNEIISTIMLNILAILLVQYLVTGPLKGEGLQYAATDAAPLQTWLRDVPVGSLLLPVGFLVALVLLVVTGLATHYSAWGWRQRLVGLGAPFALRQRLKVSNTQVHSMALSGCLAGIAGVMELLGNQHRVGYSFSPGWGFAAISIALLAQGSFPSVLPLALYFGALLNGSQNLQSDLGLSGNFVNLLVGLPVVVAAAVIGYLRFVPRRRRVRGPALGTA